MPRMPFAFRLGWQGQPWHTLGGKGRMTMLVKYTIRHVKVVALKEYNIVQSELSRVLEIFSLWSLWPKRGISLRMSS
jgi:hypothetical protein